jgi:hypothetical protein
MELHRQIELGVAELLDGDNGVQVHPVTKADSESGYRFTLDMCPWNPGTRPRGLPVALHLEHLDHASYCKVLCEDGLTLWFLAVSCQTKGYG